MVKKLHDGIQASVQNGGQLSAPFPAINCVKQGCVLAPTLFSIVLSALLSDVYRDHGIGVGIRYRIDSNLKNLRRLQARTKVQEDIIRSVTFSLMMTAP